MALSRKGARRIVADGTAYHWRLRRRSTYFQALSWTSSTFALEHAGAPGTALVITTDQPRASSWFGGETKPVLPSDVVLAIEVAHPVRVGPQRRRAPRSTPTGRVEDEHRPRGSITARYFRGLSGRAGHA